MFGTAAATRTAAGVRGAVAESRHGHCRAHQAPRPGGPVAGRRRRTGRFRRGGAHLPRLGGAAPAAAHRHGAPLGDLVRRRGAHVVPPGGGGPALDGAPLLDWYREGHDRLVAALAGAPDALECWSFLSAPSPLAFWARRQAHETTVHRVDAESALGLVAGRSPVEPDLAADGIDELLCGFHGRDGSRVRTDRPGVLRVRTTDTGDVWTVALSADAPRTTRTADGPADCELTGPAEALYLSLWNRLPAGSPAVGVAGDDRLARLWRETSAVTW
ncbi:maleylpyruvate isomerase family mycothiol-dependent enzyme [Streptomyces sp. MRC013]|nr:maleylpyruvate isomerase family mycothiol-dependent enzyme [Streptomyces sp. MRC013]URM92290.1 maleylpyruvate isomerase family mycothiol-dependent enzyme [Streptomyces sp. MRC013]